MTAHDRREDRQDEVGRPRLPWDPPASDVGTTTLFVILMIPLFGVGLLLYFGTSLLFPD